MTKTKKPKTNLAPVSAPRASIPERYDAKTLVGVYRWCKANPTGVLEVRDWTRQEFTSAGWLAWFSEKLAEKINSKDPRFGTGRKCGSHAGRRSTG